MKPEEAIKVINTILLSVNHHVEIGQTVEEINKALDMAIEALQKIQKLENMINEYKQKGYSPRYVVTMEDLSYLLDMKEGESE